MHVAEEVAPTAVLYVPVAHDAQAELPVPLAYVPATQLVHVLDAVPEYCPEAQDVQVPPAELKRPEPHDKHVVAAAPL